MRRAAYILTLTALWLFSMAALALGLDSLSHPPFFPHALFAGGYWAALCSVALAEEIGEWKATLRKSRSSLPARLIDCDPTFFAIPRQQPFNQAR
jgi:hypothetical protein